MADAFIIESAPVSPSPFAAQPGDLSRNIPASSGRAKNERRSGTDELWRKRSTARRTASAREIFSRRQNNASFLSCSWDRLTLVRIGDINIRYHNPVKRTRPVINRLDFPSLETFRPDRQP